MAKALASIFLLGLAITACGQQVNTISKHAACDLYVKCSLQVASLQVANVRSSAHIGQEQDIYREQQLESLETLEAGASNYQTTHLNIQHIDHCPWVQRMTRVFASTTSICGRPEGLLSETVSR
jgi:hypothetical protein